MSSSNQTRQDLFAALQEIGKLRPEWRMGQTLANLAMMAGRLDAGGVWDLEDEEALAAAKQMLANETNNASRVATNPIAIGELQPMGAAI